MKLIMISGIKRSGSTIQYNLVRLALQMAGYEVLIRGHIFDLSEIGDLTEKQVILCKRHPFHEDMAQKADHIFLTDRKDEEIRASLTRFNGKEPQEGRIADMRKHLDKWEEYTTDMHLLPYWMWENGRMRYIGRIVDLLGVDVDIFDIEETFNEIEPPERGQDPVTLMFSNHITSE